MDQVSVGSGLHADSFNGRLHKRLWRGLIQSWLSNFSQFRSYKVGQDTLEWQHTPPQKNMPLIRKATNSIHTDVWLLLVAETFWKL